MKISEEKATENVQIVAKKKLRNNESHDAYTIQNNLENITDNRIYRKKKMRLFSDVVKSEKPSTAVGEESGKANIDLDNIQSILLRDEKLNSSKIQNSPPDICTDTSESVNTSNNSIVPTNVKTNVFSTQDLELLEILDFFVKFWNFLPKIFFDVKKKKSRMKAKIYPPPSPF